MNPRVTPRISEEMIVDPELGTCDGPGVEPVEEPGSTNGVGVEDGVEAGT